MALHDSQPLEIATYVPNSRGGIAAGCRQSLAVVVESEIQNFVIVSQQGSQAGVHSRVPHLRTFVHRGRRDQRTIEIIEAVGQLRAMADQHARPSVRDRSKIFYSRLLNSTFDVVGEEEKDCCEKNVI